MNSHALIERALRRITKIATVTRLPSQDPFLAEVGMALVDAVAAVARAAGERESAAYAIARDLRQENSALRHQIRHLEQRLQRRERPAAPPRRRWWQIFTQP